MKVRIKKTGEIVNAAEYAKITLEQCDSWGNPVEMNLDEVELIDDRKQRIPTPLTDMIESHIQEQRRWQVVLAAIPALIDTKHVVNERAVAHDACNIADAVIEAWNKRESERKRHDEK